MRDGCIPVPIAAVTPAKGTPATLSAMVRTQDPSAGLERPRPARALTSQAAAASEPRSVPLRGGRREVSAAIARFLAGSRDTANGMYATIGERSTRFWKP